MNAENLISPRIEAVAPSVNSGDALTLMYKHSIDHLPVVENGTFIGLISCNEVLEADDVFKPVGSYQFTTQNAYVEPGLHIFEVVKLAMELDLTLIPVVIDNRYIGSITLQSLVRHFANLASINDPGGIVTVTMPIRDYTLSEFSRLVESNDARILTTYVVTYPESGMLDLTVKVDKPDLTSILATLERFEYKIKETHQDSIYYEDLKERFESLMKYLNI